MHVHTVNNMHTHAHKKGQNFEFPSVTGILFHASFYLFFALFAEACGASTRPPLACRPQAGGRNTNREDRRAGGGSVRARRFFPRQRRGGSFRASGAAVRSLFVFRPSAGGFEYDLEYGSTWLEYG